MAFGGPGDLNTFRSQAQDEKFGGKLGVKKKLKRGEQLGDAYSFLLRGETGQVVLKVKVHFTEDAEMDDADIPAKPAYVPIEGSLGIAPAISTSTVVGSSLKGMASVQLFNDQ